MNTKLRPSGIEGVGDMPWGAHFCLFYETKEDLLDTLVPYFKAGLEDNEFCVWVVADPLTEEDAWRALSQAVPAFERHRSNQSIEVLRARDWYLNVGHFELDRVTNAWNRKLTQALAQGYAGMRVSGDTLWLEKKTWQSFYEYENQLDESITDQPMAVLCTYPLTSSGAAEILDVARNHQFALARRGGAWEVIETPELKQAKAEINRLNAELERRVLERTAELAAANEQLKLEIIERKQAEEALRHSEEKFKAVFEFAPVGISVLDRERKIVDMNPVLEQIIRINKEGLLAGAYMGRTYLRPDGTPRPFSEWASERAISENQPIYGVETGIVLEDGQLIWVQVNAVPLGLPDASVVVITQDITERKRAEEALRESEEKFSAAFRASPVALVIATLDGKYVEVNQAFCDLLGYSREELLGKTAIDLGILSAEAYQEWVEALGREGGALTNIELSYRFRDGISRAALSSVETIIFHGVPHLLSTSLDITEHQQAEAAIRSLLQISEKLHATLDIDALLDSLIIEAMKLIDAEIGWSGLRTEEGMVLHTHIARDLQAVSFPYLWAPGVGLPGWVLVHKVPYVMNDAQSDKMIIPEIRKRFGVKAAIDTPILDAQGEVIGFFEVNNKKNGAGFSESDVEKLVAVSRIASIALQNARLFEELRQSHEQLKALSSRLAEVQESERKRLAREIHDDISQSLTALTMQLGTARSLLPKTAGTARNILEQTEDLTQKTLERTRMMIADLRPSILDDLGLVPALRRLGDELHENTGALVRMKMARLPKRLPPQLEVALFRITQEALTNIRRHAQARHVTVTLTKTPGWVNLSVQDDGVGLENQAPGSNQSDDVVVAGDRVIPEGHFGLIGMQERVTLLGGKFQVTSTPNQGTTIRVELPL